MRNAIIVFLIKDQQVLLIHSYYDTTRTRVFWQGISGYVEAGESAVDAAVREAREELDITIQPEDLVQKHTLELPDTFFTIFTTDTWHGDMKLLEQGLEELRWFPIDQLPWDEMHPTDKDWLPSILQDEITKEA